MCLGSNCLNFSVSHVYWKKFKKKLYKLKDLMGETLQNLGALGKGVVVDRQEETVIECSDNNLVKRKQTIIRERYVKEKHSSSLREKQKSNTTTTTNNNNSSNDNQNARSRSRTRKKKDCIEGAAGDSTTDGQAKNAQKNFDEVLSKPLGPSEVIALKWDIEAEIDRLKRRRKSLISAFKHQEDVLAKPMAAVQDEKPCEETHSKSKPHHKHKTCADAKAPSDQKKMIPPPQCQECNAYIGCHPRMRTIGLHMSSCPDINKYLKKECSLSALKLKYDPVAAMIPTAYGCFDYGPNYALADYYNKNNCANGYQYYNNAGNYGYACNQNMYCDSPHSPGSDYCHGTHYYNCQPSIARLWHRQQGNCQPTVCCPREGRSIRRQKTDLNTNELCSIRKEKKKLLAEDEERAKEQGWRRKKRRSKSKSNECEPTAGPENDDEDAGRIAKQLTTDKAQKPAWSVEECDSSIQKRYTRVCDPCVAPCCALETTRIISYTHRSSRSRSRSRRRVSTDSETPAVRDITKEKRYAEYINKYKQDCEQDAGEKSLDDQLQSSGKDGAKALVKERKKGKGQSNRNRKNCGCLQGESEVNLSPASPASKANRSRDTNKGATSHSSRRKHSSTPKKINHSATDDCEDNPSPHERSIQAASATKDNRSRHTSKDAARSDRRKHLNPTERSCCCCSDESEESPSPRAKKEGTEAAASKANRSRGTTKDANRNKRDQYLSPYWKPLPCSNDELNAKPSAREKKRTEAKTSKDNRSRHTKKDVDQAERSKYLSPTWRTCPCGSDESEENPSPQEKKRTAAPESKDNRSRRANKDADRSKRDQYLSPTLKACPSGTDESEGNALPQERTKDKRSRHTNKDANRSDRNKHLSPTWKTRPNCNDESEVSPAAGPNDQSLTLRERLAIRNAFLRCSEEYAVDTNCNNNDQQQWPVQEHLPSKSHRENPPPVDPYNSNYYASCDELKQQIKEICAHKSLHRQQQGKLIRALQEKIDQLMAAATADQHFNERCLTPFCIPGDEVVNRCHNSHKRMRNDPCVSSSSKTVHKKTDTLAFSTPGQELLLRIQNIKKERHSSPSPKAVHKTDMPADSNPKYNDPCDAIVHKKTNRTADTIPGEEASQRSHRKPQMNDPCVSPSPTTVDKISETSTDRIPGEELLRRVYNNYMEQQNDPCDCPCPPTVLKGSDMTANAIPGEEVLRRIYNNHTEQRSDACDCPSPANAIQNTIETPRIADFSRSSPNSPNVPQIVAECVPDSPRNNGKMYSGEAWRDHHSPNPHEKSLQQQMQSQQRKYIPSGTNRSPRYSSEEEASRSCACEQTRQRPVKSEKRKPLKSTSAERRTPNYYSDDQIKRSPNALLSSVSNASGYRTNGYEYEGSPRYRPLRCPRNIDLGMPEYTGCDCMLNTYLDILEAATEHCGSGSDN